MCLVVIVAIFRQTIAQVSVHVAQVVLLLPDDRPRPHDPQPPHGLPRREAVPPQHVERDEHAGATESGLAVDGDGARRGVDDAEDMAG